MASTSNISGHPRVEESAPSTSTSGRSYDVFINHRGPDVKHTLAALLYKMLTAGMGLKVFLDSEELESGDYLPTELEAAMKSASLHIAIFSQNYAQSKWCLDELSFMRDTGTRIVPIFYYVTPDDVRYAKGVYAAAFDGHKKKGRYSPEKLQGWKDVLYNVSHNIGYIINSKEDEEMMLERIKYCIVKEVNKVPFVDAEHPVGLDEAVQDFEYFRSLISHEKVQIMGIWGKGGSGKTTLAKKLYNNIYPYMEKSSLILDVRDADTNRLLHTKQKKLLENLGFKSVAVDCIEEGKAILASRLRSVQAFIVLDDVDHVDQLNALLLNKDSLGSESLIGSGSLIVVTTRDLEVLRAWGISSVYEMKPLSPFHAKQLFCWHAFLQPSPRDGFEELVQQFIEVCSGLPLSLKVLGGQLYGKFSKYYWETQLDKISRILPHDIKKRLKISYDALDDEEKEAFLDTACFFIGERINLAIEVWNGSGWSGSHTWRKLVNKCLVEEVVEKDVEKDGQNSIRMHDHLRDLGREIANQQSPYRLCFLQQNIKVDNEEQSGIGIRGIKTTFARATCTFMEKYTIREPADTAEEFSDCSSPTELKVNTSKGIWTLAPSRLGLKIIVARGPNLNQVIKSSRNLVWLRWFDSEQRNLQSLISLKNLRILELVSATKGGNHHLRELWVDEFPPLQLRELVIDECHEFQGFPKSIQHLKYLKKIVLFYLNRTSKVKNLPKEFCSLQSLEYLDLVGCVELSSLPNSMGNLRNLRHLDLIRCFKLRTLPDSFKKLTLLQYLRLRECESLTIKLDILENMTKLEFLDFSYCNALEWLSCHITNQPCLRDLLAFDTLFREFPMNIGQLSKLQRLHIGNDWLTSLPASLGDLCSLNELFIIRCRKLEYLPDSLERLNLLRTLYIISSGVRSLPVSVFQLINLKMLQIKDCPISELDFGAGPFSSSFCNLESISLLGTELSKISISADCCPRLNNLTLKRMDHLTEIEFRGIVGLVNLQELRIIDCHKLDTLPNFAQLPSLREFELRGCYQVKEIQGLQHCRELEVLKAFTEWEVPGIQSSLECMERLGTLHLRAIRKSVVEGCIQSLQQWPREMTVCMPVVRNAASLLDSFTSLANSSAFPTLSVVDSCSNLKIDEILSAKLVRKQPTSGNATILCFVINCVSPHMPLMILDGESYSEICETAVEEGKWVWIAVFTQRSQWHTAKTYEIGYGEDFEDGATYEVEVDYDYEVEVEKGLLVMGEEQRLLEAFCRLWGVLAI